MNELHQTFALCSSLKTLSGKEGTVDLRMMLMAVKAVSSTLDLGDLQLVDTLMQHRSCQDFDSHDIHLFSFSR